MLQLLWKTAWRFFKKLNIELSHDPAIPLLNLYLKNWKQVLKYLYMKVYSSTMYNSQKVETTQTSINYETLIYTTIRMNLKNIMLNESSHTPKVTILYDSLYMNCPKYIHPQRQQAGWWLPGAEGRGWLGVTVGWSCFLGWWKCFRTRYRWWWHNVVNVLKATELYVWKRQILCYVNFIAIKKKIKLMSPCGKDVEHICLQSLIRLGISCVQVPQLEHRPTGGAAFTWACCTRLPWDVRGKGTTWTWSSSCLLCWNELSTRACCYLPSRIHASVVSSPSPGLLESPPCSLMIMGQWGLQSLPSKGAVCHRNEMYSGKCQAHPMLAFTPVMPRRSVGKASAKYPWLSDTYSERTKISKQASKKHQEGTDWEGEQGFSECLILWCEWWLHGYNICEEGYNQ